MMMIELFSLLNSMK